MSMLVNRILIAFIVCNALIASAVRFHVHSIKADLAFSDMKTNIPVPDAFNLPRNTRTTTETKTEFHCSIFRFSVRRSFTVLDFGSR